MNNWFQSGSRIVALHETPPIYQYDQQMKHLQHISFAECAIPIWGKALLGCERLCPIAYFEATDVASAHPSLMNVASDVPPLAVDEALFGTISR